MDMMIGNVLKLDVFNQYIDSFVSDIIKKENIRCGSNKNVALRNYLNKRFLSENQSGFKIVRLNKRYKVQESSPLLDLNFQTIIDENWKDTDLYALFKKPLHFLVLRDEEKDVKFLGVFRWSLSESDTEQHIRPFWEKLQRIVQEGVVLQETSRGISNNLPGQADHPVLHVRPKARNSKDTTLLPDGRSITKQGVWLNSNYIRELVMYYLYENDYLKKEYVNQSRVSAIKEEITQKELIELVSKPILTEKEKNKIITYSKKDKIIYRFNQKFVKRGNFYLDQKYPSLERYFIDTIRKMSYFSKSDFKQYHTQTLDKVVRELNKELSIIKIEEDRYITSFQLFKANVSKNQLHDYIDSVHVFSSENFIFEFTLTYLKKRGFYHELLDLGFNELFYIDLLKNDPRITTKRLRGNVLFSIRDSNHIFHDIVSQQLKIENSISAGRLFEVLRTEYGIIFKDYFEFKNAFKEEESSIYYAEKMDYIFKNYDVYIQEVINNANKY